MSIARRCEFGAPRWCLADQYRWVAFNGSSTGRTGRTRRTLMAEEMLSRRLCPEENRKFNWDVLQACKASQEGCKWGEGWNHLDLFSLKQLKWKFNPTWDSNVSINFYAADSTRPTLKRNCENIPRNIQIHLKDAALRNKVGPLLMNHWESFSNKFQTFFR
jgi:hypothetical protein